MTGPVFGVFTIGMLYPWANKTVNAAIKFQSLRETILTTYFVVAGCLIRYLYQYGRDFYDYCKYSVSYCAGKITL